MPSLPEWVSWTLIAVSVFLACLSLSFPYLYRQWTTRIAAKQSAQKDAEKLRMQSEGREQLIPVLEAWNVFAEAAGRSVTSRLETDQKISSDERNKLRGLAEALVDLKLPEGSISYAAAEADSNLRLLSGSRVDLHRFNDWLMDRSILLSRLATRYKL